MKKKASKSRNANFSEEKLLLAELEKQYPYMSALKKNVIVEKKTWKVSKAEMPIVTSAIWRQFRDVGSAWNCKPKRNLMSNGGKGRRQVVVKPLPHKTLLVSWLLTVFQRSDNSLVIDDTDEPVPSVQCSMPSTSLSQDRKRTAKRKKKVKVSVVE